MSTTSSTGSADPYAEWTGVVDAAIFAALHTDATELTWNCALGIGLEGIVLGAILSQVYRYFEHFHRRDTRLTLCLVALGTAGCLGQFALNLWQTYLFIQNGATAVYLVLEKDVYADMTVLILVGLYNLAAAIYFSRRAIKLIGNRWVIIPLGVLCLASFAMCIACVSHGFHVPSTTTTMKSWLSTVNTYVIAWATVSLLTDMCVCGLMTYALVQSRLEIQAAATSLLRKLLLLTFETMLPPLIAVLILLAYGCSASATLGNFTRALGWIIGPLYFHAIIHSLVGRHDVSLLLEHRNRDPILGAAHHPAPAPLPNLPNLNQRAAMDAPFSEGVLPLHRAWSSEKTFMGMGIGMGMDSDGPSPSSPTSLTGLTGPPSPPRHGHGHGHPRARMASGSGSGERLHYAERGERGEQAGEALPPVPVRPVIPLFPVVMDEKAKQELGFGDENEFGATLK